jgi:hypothetical protein
MNQKKKNQARNPKVKGVEVQIGHEEVEAGTGEVAVVIVEAEAEIDIEGVEVEIDIEEVEAQTEAEIDIEEAAAIAETDTEDTIEEVEVEIAEDRKDRILVLLLRKPIFCEPMLNNSLRYSKKKERSASPPKKDSNTPEAPAKRGVQMDTLRALYGAHTSSTSSVIPKISELPLTTF